MNKDARRNAIRGLLIAGAVLIALLGYGRYQAPGAVSPLALVTWGSIGVLIGALIAAAFLPARGTDTTRIVAGVIALIAAATALVPDQPAWLDAARAVAVIVCALVAIRTFPDERARRRPLVLLAVGLALGGLLGAVLLARAAGALL